MGVGEAERRATNIDDAPFLKQLGKCIVSRVSRSIVNRATKATS